MATKTAAVDAKGYRKFGFRDVLAYGLGDFGCNMSFALKGTLTISGRSTWASIPS